jgi:CRISPR-associated exonuclease Cas4
MTITGTHVAYYHVCQRKLWLFANSIQMEHNSDIVYEGKFIGETTYAGRAEKNTQVELSVPLPFLDDPEGQAWSGAAKIDFYNAKTKTVHETKKSDKMEQAHIAQVQFYLYLLQRSGVEGAQGIIEYPKLRERTQVTLTSAHVLVVEQWVADIQRIIATPTCPNPIHKPVCKKCAYYEYCYADEI